MPFCPRCHERYEAGRAACPACGEVFAPAGRDPNQGELFQTVSIYKVPDEITGMALHSFLIDAGIQATLVDQHGSFYGSVLTNLQGFWGEILVPQEAAEQARQCVDKFWQEFHRGR